MVKGAFIGFGVTLIALAIPIIHFISGPIGPFIGGWIGGAKAHATPGRAIGLGLLMGLLMASPVIGAIVLSIFISGIISEDMKRILWFVAVGLSIYTGLLGTLGALLGGRQALNKAGEKLQSIDTAAVSEN
jgi:hypothetical protein